MFEEILAYGIRLRSAHCREFPYSKLWRHATALELPKNYLTLAMISIDKDTEAIFIPGWGTGCPGSGQRIDRHQTVHHRPGQKYFYIKIRQKFRKSAIIYVLKSAKNLENPNNFFDH